MNPYLTLSLIVGYFLLLIVISLIVNRRSPHDNKTFFTGNRNTPWYIIAFGMIGTTISGVTFISVPGKVSVGGWGYMQVVLGYIIGYATIATVLLPLYYRLNIISIYEYLQQRFGAKSHKTGASFFLLSRLIGSGLRLYLVALVLQSAVFDYFGLPFWFTVVVSIGLIYLYTFQSGVKTVIWTDTAQTVGLLAGLVISIVIILKTLQWDMSATAQHLLASPTARLFTWDALPRNSFWKDFFGGAAVALAMTGLDQDMMQKNLACRSLAEAKRNMLWFTITLVFVNVLFLVLGALLYEYGTAIGAIEGVEKGKVLFREAGSAAATAIRSDQLFPKLAFQYLGAGAALTFIMGVIAAAYSSADSALTALTTSFYVDILGIKDMQDTSAARNKRRLVHVGFAAAMCAVILIFHRLNDAAVVDKVLEVAGYTYGPLLGLYAFGVLTQRRVRDALVPVVCVLAPVASYLAALYIPQWTGYAFGFELLIFNAALTFCGLWGISRKA